MAEGCSSHVAKDFWYLGLEDTKNFDFSLPDNQSLDGISSQTLSDNQLPSDISSEGLQNDQLPNQISSHGLYNDHGTSFHSLTNEVGTASQYYDFPLDNSNVFSFFDPVSLNPPCNNCGSTDCLFTAHCDHQPLHPSYLPAQQGPWAAHLPNRAARNESGSTQLQEMESSTQAGVVPAPTTLPNHPSPRAPAPASPTISLTELELQSRGAARYMDPSQDSNVRRSSEDSSNALAVKKQSSSPIYLEPNSADRNAANTLGSLNHASNGNSLDNNMWHEEAADARMLLNGGAKPPNDLTTNPNALDDAYEVPRETSAFAKLVFPDGDYYVNHTNVIIGRNMDQYKEVVRTTKQREQAQAALHQYEQEPSRTSQQGDGDAQGSQSRSSQSLEGRPAPPSNVSEHGGVVSYQPQAGVEDDVQFARPRKRRSMAVSKSSSNASVDPSKIQSGASLDNDATLDSDNEDDRTWTHLPVHTQIPDDIRKISKQHLILAYNFQRACWQLHVLGNGAYVNGHLFPRKEVIELHHNDEIIFSTVQVTFKLPDDRGSPGLSQGTFSRSDDESDLDNDQVRDTLEWTSPVRRLSNVFEDASSDPDDQGDVDNTAKPKSRLKNKPKKPKIGSPTQTTKKEKKKPKAADKPAPEPKKEDKASPPVQIDPDSSLANIPVEELPAKRKGPGRPPKNGVLSKRDQALVTKKQKEYEKRGEDLPPFADLVDMVRREQKAREQQKAMSNGDIAMGAVLPSIETGANGNSTKTAAGSNSKVARKRTASEELQRVSPSNPKKRKHPSLSPIPPKASLDPQQLLPPSKTYLLILNEILEEHPDGEADLPDLYARLKKKYPYYEYIVEGNGWQSSVRHNLKTPRFEQSGRSGKGHFWKINYASSIEQAMKKQRQNQQPKQPTLQQPPQHRQAGYGNQHAQMNGQPQFNANQAAYSSPYGQPGQNGQYMGQHAQAGPPNAAGQAPNGQPAPIPPTKWEQVLQRFVSLQTRYFNNFTNSTEEEKEQRKTYYETCMGILSTAFGNLQDPKPDSIESAVAASGQLPAPKDDFDESMRSELIDLFVGGSLVEAARDKYEREQQEKQEKQDTAAQAVDNAAATAPAPSAAPEERDGDVPMTQPIGDSSLPRVDTSAPAQPPNLATAVTNDGEPPEKQEEQQHLAA